MKSKLNIETLKVQSFVTDLKNGSVKTVKGGGDTIGAGGDAKYDKNRPFYTRVHDCDQPTSPFQCPTQDNVGACESNNSPC